MLSVWPECALSLHNGQAAPVQHMQRLNPSPCQPEPTLSANHAELFLPLTAKMVQVSLS